MENGVLNPAPEVSLDELLNADDMEHLVCGCRPQFTLCGRYFPDVDNVLYTDLGPKDCVDCTKVWKGTGCGVCWCNINVACAPCRSRYYAHQAATD